MADSPIRREAGQSVEEMAEQLSSAPQNKMYLKGEEGSNSREFISELVQSGLDSLMVCYPQMAERPEQTIRKGRVNLDSADAVRDTAARYLAACARAGRVPFFTVFCSALGYSRKYVYEVIRQRKNATTDFLDYFAGLCAGIAEEAATNRKVSEVFTIFALKNSNQGYADRVDITAQAAKVDPYESGDPEEIARRYLAGMAGDYATTKGDYQA